MSLVHKGVLFAEDPIKIIEELLQRAKAGEVIGIAYTVHTSEDEFQVGFAGSVLQHPLQTIGILEFMQLDFVHSVRRNLRVAP